jgi:hypothetical protein
LQIVVSGGTANSATISAGTLDVQSGATAGSSTISFAGGGTLKLDGTGAYSFLVAGFAVPDAFDLSAINFASATNQNFVPRPGRLAHRANTAKLAQSLLSSGMMKGRPAADIDSVVQALSSRQQYPSHGSPLSGPQGQGQSDLDGQC